MRLIDADWLVSMLKAQPYSGDGPIGKGYAEQVIMRIIDTMPTQDGVINITNHGKITITDAEDSTVEKKYRNAAMQVMRSGWEWTNECVTIFCGQKMHVTIRVKPNGWGCKRNETN